MPDFTPPTLRVLLSAFLTGGFSFTPLSSYTEVSGKKTVILRHDVDRLPANSLATAQLEHETGISGKAMAASPVTNPDFLGRSYHTTSGIIGAVEKGGFPNQVMMTIHPQRWTSNIFLWSKEFISQNLKNQVKRFMVK